jgi:hypothetical protein
MLPDSVRSQLLVRTLWASLQHPELTHQQARELAAQQLAEEERERAQHQQHKPKPRQRRAADVADLRAVPGALLSKIFGLMDRIEARRRKPPAASPRPPQAAPAPTTLVEKVIAAFTPAPEPPPPQYSLFASSDGVVRQLSDDESPQLTNAATRNYRASTMRNVIDFEEKRGGVPARKSWLIG